MPRKITVDELRSLNLGAHHDLMELKGLERVIEIEVDDEGKSFAQACYSALAAFAGDEDPESQVTLHYGPDTHWEWLEF